MTKRNPAVHAVIVILALLGAACSGEAGNTAGDADESASNLVQLDSASLTAAEIDVDSVRAVVATTLSAAGTLTYDENAVARVGPKTEGRIVRVRGDLGAWVQAGTVLAVLEGQELGDIQAELGRARASVEVTRQNYERERRLFDQRVSSEKEMLEARAAYESAMADLEAAEAKVRTLGGLVDDATGFAVTSPIAGTVVERSALMGQIAGPGDQLFTVADLRHLWLILDIYERDLARVVEGQAVGIRTQAFPEAVFAGEVAYLGQVVDPESHTIKARVVVDNPGQLRPGMFAQAEIVLPVAPGTLAVPKVAIQELRGSEVVFVPEGDGAFRAVRVVTGAEAPGGLLIVVADLHRGQRVVGRGSFFLKSELMKSTFGDVD